jgi:hypothetical protein
MPFSMADFATIYKLQVCRTLKLFGRSFQIWFAGDSEKSQCLVSILPVLGTLGIILCQQQAHFIDEKTEAQGC